MSKDYSIQIAEILEEASYQVSDVKPSVWGEENRTMTPDVSPIPGKLSYKNSPYTREIVDCLAPDHPAHTIAIKKGAQIGFSTTVIETGIGWIISQNPGNILFLVGHEDLVGDAMKKVDRMIDSTGIRNLIRSTVQRAKNNKSGDTDKIKEFPNGYLRLGIANHKTLRNISMQYGFVDDLEGMKGNTKQSGSTVEMIEQRFAAYAKKKKLFFISTPELKQSSNIEPVYLLGDQRKFHIPCPCCKEMIALEWSIQSEKDEKEMAGVTWKLDESNKLIPESVGYICQKCGEFFNDSAKDKLLAQGIWIPTSEPSREGYYSYHISSLYAPSYMYGWEDYIYKFIKACPPGEPRNEKLYQTFVNLVLGETYDSPAESPKANELQKNIRNYEIGIIPEKLSEADGNGKIVLLTLACDLNGKLEDARLDYEVVAWSASGSTYSITHGSIGTFIPNESAKKNKVQREAWTYIHHRPNSVWKEFDDLINTIWVTDTGRKMKIGIAGMDTGHCESEAFQYIDNRPNLPVIGLKGDKEDKYIPFGIDMPSFKVGRSRSNLYLLRGGQIKDELSNLIKLRWDDGMDDVQPAGFLNFPTPSGGKYLFNNFFSHYESEERAIEKNKDGEGVSAIWRKKNNIAQNHLWDCRYYNMGLRDILLYNFFRIAKIKNGTWADYVKLVSPSAK